MKEKVLGYEVDIRSKPILIDDLFASIRNAPAQNGSGTWVACLNPHSYVLALEDTLFNQALHSADWLVADGVGVVLASRLLGGRISERLTGSDIFYGLNERLNATQESSCFFLGSTDKTLAHIRQKMELDYPNIRVAGTYSPPYKAEFSQSELDEMIAAVNAANADILWVGLSAPKQEKWIFENLARLNVKFAGAIGAVFDFYTGNVKRSHPCFFNLGLEWLPRLFQQPQRLWKRMFVSAPVFVWHVLLQRFGLRRY